MYTPPPQDPHPSPVLDNKKLLEKWDPTWSMKALSKLKHFYLQEGIEAREVSLLLPEAGVVCLKNRFVAGHQPVLRRAKGKDVMLHFGGIFLKSNSRLEKEQEIDLSRPKKNKEKKNKGSGICVLEKTSKHHKRGDRPCKEAATAAVVFDWASRCERMIVKERVRETHRERE